MEHDSTQRSGGAGDTPPHERLTSTAHQVHRAASPASLVSLHPGANIKNRGGVCIYFLHQTFHPPTIIKPLTLQFHNAIYKKKPQLQLPFCGTAR